MLSSFIEEIYSWNTTALDKVLADAAGGKTIHYSKSVNEEGYNLEMKLYQYDTMGVNLPRRRIPNTVTLYAFNLVCREYPLAFPVLLKYLMHNDLLKDARKDLDNIHQTLQEMMDQDLENLQEQLAQKEQLTKVEEFQFIREIFEIETCKKYMADLFSGKTLEIKTSDIKDAKIGTYAHKYYSKLESNFIAMMKKKLTVYANDDNAINNLYQSLNNKAEKVERLDCIINAVLITSILLTGAAYTATIAKALADKNGLIFAMIIPSACILFIGFAIAGTVRSKRVDAKVSLANELEDYIVGSKQMEEVTHTKTENLMVSSDINELLKVQYARQYPDLSGMDEYHLLN